jgi:hypothetical protein
MNDNLNGLELVLLIKTKWMIMWMVWNVCCSHSRFRNARVFRPILDKGDNVSLMIQQHVTANGNPH